MKYQLFQYNLHGKARAGVCFGDAHYDLSVLGETFAELSLVDRSVDALLEGWGDATQALGRVAAEVAVGNVTCTSLHQVSFLSPIKSPGAIYCAGANYRDHVEAMAKAFGINLVSDPKAAGVPPWHFIKPGRACLASHEQNVEMPSYTHKLDYEAELAVVIGFTASKVSVEDALQFVAGYSCANDLSARDQMVRDAVDPSSPFRFDWIGHKCFTGSCPLGPYLTPAEFVPDPENLGIRMWLNGALVQDSNTNNHLYNIAEQISFLSHRVNLFPGDVLLTGTPAGVGSERGVFLNQGDAMTVEIDGLGRLSTTIV
jgi:2-keto-4-pentenoate hydratase/2-oxohepta-3-ene-1,7-dioic acid hydratase in catechol pathway